MFWTFKDMRSGMDTSSIAESITGQKERISEQQKASEVNSFNFSIEGIQGTEWGTACSIMVKNFEKIQKSVDKFEK